MILSLALFLFAQDPGRQPPPPIGEQPDLVQTYGPLTLQVLHAWTPEMTPDSQAKIAFGYLVAGGFRDRPVLPDIGMSGINDNRKAIKRALGRMRAKGILIFSVGFEGADEDSNPENVGNGLFKPIGHPQFGDPDAYWYYRDVGLALSILRSLYPAVQVWGAGGISAGAMCSLRPEADLDYVVALDLFSCWPCMKDDLAHISRSYLAKKGTLDEPYDVLGDAAMSDRILASIPVVEFSGPVFFGNQYPATFGLVDTDPVTGVRNLLLNVHDLAQSIWAWQERGSGDDELYVLLQHATGLQGEKTWTGMDMPAGAKTSSDELWQEIEAWILRESKELLEGR